MPTPKPPDHPRPHIGQSSSKSRTVSHQTHIKLREPRPSREYLFCTTGTVIKREFVDYIAPSSNADDAPD